MRDTNEFITEHTEHTEHRKDFEKMHGGLPFPGMQLMFHIHSLFRTLLHHALPNNFFLDIHVDIVVII